MEGVQEFERACLDFQNPLLRHQAEEQLIKLRNGPQCFQLCQQVLLQSTCSSAKFQAVLALRDSAISRWNGLTQDAKDELRSFLLTQTLRMCRSNDPSEVVARSLTATFAALLKIDWQHEAPARFRAGISEIISQASAGLPSQQQCAALQLLNAIVTEFSPATASRLDKTWKFHEQCKRCFQQHYLRDIILCARTALEAVTVGARPESGNACRASVDLLTSLLTWDYRDAAAARNGIGQGRPTSTGQERICLGKEWFQLLVDDNILLCLSQLISRLKGQCCVLSSAARELLVTYSAVTNDQTAAKARTLPAECTPLLQCVMSALLSWITPVEAAFRHAYANSADELLDACRVFSMLAQVHGSSIFQTSVVGISAYQMQGVIGQLVELTRTAIAAGGCTEEQEGTWLWDMCDRLLEAWVALLLKESSWMSSGASPQSQAVAEAIFQVVLESSLGEARQGAADDEEEGEAAAEAGPDGDNTIHESFSRTAVFGRCCLPQAIAILGGLLQERINRATTSAAMGASGESPSGTVDVAVTLEEICWLVEMAAHLLADSGDGEVPQLPAAVSAAIQLPESEQALLQLSQLILAIPNFCSDPKLKHLASPRLMEKACWAAGRWAETYLLAEQPISASLEQDFGKQGKGVVIAQKLTSIAVSLLFGEAWLGEVDLHRIVILKLLGMMGRRRLMREAMLHSSDWQCLLGKLAAQDSGIRQLDRRLIRPLTRIVCETLSDSAGHSEAHAALTSILRNPIGEVMSMASAPSQYSQSTLPGRTLFLVSMLCGAFEAAASNAQLLLWDSFRQVADSCVRLMDLQHTDTEVVVCLLKLAKLVTEAFMPYLEDKDASSLIQWDLQLLSLFKKHRAGSADAAVSTIVQSEAVDGMYRSLKHIVNTLAAVIQREAAYLGPSEHAQPSIDLAEAVVQALGIILPCMGETQLMFPKLARSYFQLLGDLIEIFPDRILAISGGGNVSVLQTMQWGLSSSDLSMLQPSLDALAALMKVWASNPNPAGKHADWPHVLAQTVLNRLLTEHNWQQFVDHAADCLLPYIAREPGRFQSLFQQLWTNIPIKEQARARQCLQELSMRAHAQYSSRAAGKREWRSCFGQFAMVLREFGRKC